MNLNVILQNFARRCALIFLFRLISLSTDYPKGTTKQDLVEV